MTIEIPDSILEKAGLSADKVVLELAIVLFQQELAKREISIHYGIEEFERDLEIIKQIQS
jgi:predicted HTH domain antitoxin